MLLSAFVGGLSDRDATLMREAGVVAWWQTSVPEEIARHTLGVSMRDGELSVAVDSSTWAAEWSALSEQLRENIEEAAGKGSVRSIRFTVSRRVQMARDDERELEELDDLYKPEDVEPVALSPQERAQIEHAAEQIDDEELRQAFVEAMVTDMELDKGRKARSGPQKGARKPTG
jgi:superfamily I DNA and RNA helicase